MAMPPELAERPRRRAFWALVVAGWGVASVVYASHLYLFHTLRGAETRFGFQLAEAVAHFGVWAALTPAVLALARARPLPSRRWPRHLAFHLGAGLAVALAQLALHTVLDHLWIHGGAGGLAGFAERFSKLFTRTGFANVLLYFALVVAVGAVEQAHRRRLREAELQRHLAQAQLDALRLQLQPHFLFNALNSVSALIPEDAAAAQRMVARLSDLLRRALDPANAGEVPLSRELEAARSYLDVEEVRFQDRLRVEVSVPAELGGAAVPGLLLQPLLENAVRHGIARRPGGGRIELAAEARGDRLRLVVRDDGDGPEDAPRAGGLGIGLANVRARLVQIYGEDHRLELRELAAGGAEAMVEIPLRRLEVPRQ